VKPTVYIETTIPSYYCDRRTELARDITRTREWWDEERHLYEVFISLAVVDELEHGNYPRKNECLGFVRGLPLLDVTPEVEEIAEAYWTHRLMPRPPVRDALHVAIASFYRLDYLLTWNCTHLANANKAVHLEMLNARLHLGLPRLVTPEQLRPLEDYS
jgi:hypothetical protein